MAAITWSETTVTVNVGSTAIVNFTYGKELEMMYTVTTADAGVATISTSGDPSGFSGVATITGVSAGTTVTVPGGSDTQNAPITITVKAADDEEYLNKRGLTHFWGNIDTLKQDKLTAGDNISISASNVISSDMGWVYLGCAHTDTAVQQFDFTLPASYDNYKIIANAEMNYTISNNTWITLSSLVGTTFQTFSGFIETVNGTSWSCAAVTNTDYISQNTSYPYFSVLFEAMSLRGRSAESRHWITRCVSGGGNSNGKTTRGNMHTSGGGSDPTAFRLRMSAANSIRSGSIYVWGMNNPTS